MQNTNMVKTQDLLANLKRPCVVAVLSRRHYLGVQHLGQCRMRHSLRESGDWKVGSVVRSALSYNPMQVARCGQCRTARA